MAQWVAVVLLATSAISCVAGDPAQSNDQFIDRLDAVEVESWADDVFGRMFDERRFSALAIAVTQNDDVIIEKGYGYAKWDDLTPVDPETAQFRIGSLTKTFLGTAIAQLWERGGIDSLDDPVNKYLERIQVESPFGREITIWDMVTHQGGMATAPVYVPISDPRPSPPLPPDYLTAHTPPVVREPGTISLYCNPCSATLGFMVEDITGQTLEEYFRENIYEPLGMHHTVLTNALTPGPNVITQYAFPPDGPPVDLPYPAISPYISYAGDMNSTAGDMAKWLIAHVEAGEGDGPAILRPETFQMLHSRKRGNHPHASGFGVQFFTYEYNGEPIIEHYGSIQFRSMEIMMLDQKIGVFVTMAGGGPPPGVADEGGSAGVLPALSHSGVRDLVLRYFLGDPSTSIQLQVDVNDYLGVYQAIQVAPDAQRSGRGRLVEPSGDGGLIIGGVGVYRSAGDGIFVLDRPLPLEAGFGESSRYVFERALDGTMRMFAHVNAGGFERVDD